MSCTAVSSSQSRWIGGDSVSYAMYALDHIVSPPTEGNWTQRSREPMGGSGSKVLSLCHSSPPSPLGSTWSRRWMGLDWSLLNAGMLSLPNRSANRACSSSSMGWSLKKSTRCSSQPCLMAWTSSSDNGLRRSTPVTSAPMFLVMGLNSIMSPGFLPLRHPPSASKQATAWSSQRAVPPLCTGVAPAARAVTHAGRTGSGGRRVAEHVAPSAQCSIWPDGLPHPRQTRTSRSGSSTSTFRPRCARAIWSTRTP